MSDDPQTRDEGGPVWIIKDPTPSYHGYKTYPGTVDRKLGPAAYPGDMGTLLRPDDLGVTTIPPLNPQQLTPEDMERELNELRAKVYDYKLRYEAAYAVAEAARVAVPDIETVFGTYGHIQTHPLPNLRALLDLLAPPTPKWEPRNGGDF